MRVIDVGVHLHGLRLPVNSLPNPFGAGWGDVANPFEILLLDLSCIRLDGMPVSSVYGKTGGIPGVPAEAKVYGLEPIRIPYDSHRDFKNYANGVFWPLNGLNSAPSSFEKSVIHTTAPEGIRQAGRELYHVKSKEAFAGTHVSWYEPNDGPTNRWPFFTTDDGSIGVNQYVANWASYFVPFGATWDRHMRDAESILDAIPGGPYLLDIPQFDLTAWRGQGSLGATPRGARARRLEAPRRGFHAEYKAIAVSGNYYLISTDRRLTVEVVSVGTKEPVGFHPFGTRLHVSLRAVYEDVSAFYYKNAGAGDDDPWLIVPGFESVPSYNVVEAAGTTTVVLSRAYNSDDGNENCRRLLQRVQDRVRSLGPDIRPSSAISSADAMSKINTESNYIEALAEVGTSLELVGGIATGANALTKLFELRVHDARSAWSFVWNLSQLLADVQLLYAFGIKPSIQDTINITREAERLRKLALILQHRWFLRGRHDFEVMDGDTPVTVTVRSKLCFPPVRADESLFIKRTDSSGTLWTPSRIWNSQKYTFLVDYVAHIGQRMRVVELYVMQSLYNLRYGVHSFEHRLRIPSDEEFSSDSGDDIEVVVYVREVSVYVSDPSRSTKFDFMPPAPPSIGVFLALIVKALQIFVRQFG